VELTFDRRYDPEIDELPEPEPLQLDEELEQEMEEVEALPPPIMDEQTLEEVPVQERVVLRMSPGWKGRHDLEALIPAFTAVGPL